MMTTTTETPKAPRGKSAPAENTYIQWVGKRYYPTIEAYCEEATRMGVSKRIPNAEVGAKLAREGAVVFLCHDEGEYDDCANCDGTGGQVRVTPRMPEIAEDFAADGIFDAGATSELWTYTNWLYWVRQPKKFDPDTCHVDKAMCEECGGKGKLPRGMVFGVFIPNAVEYIMSEEDTEALTEALTKRGMTVVPTVAIAAEAKRGCGKRHAGGTYLVTTGEEASDADKAAMLRELIETGRITPAADLKGMFLRFIDPVPYAGKRFLGIKHWTPDEATANELRLIIEALEG